MVKKNKKDEKYVLELEQAEHFMSWVTLHKPSRIRRLDKKKDRKRPDFAFYYASGQRYTLELTRWLTKELIQLQVQAERSVAKPLQNRLNGTFVLYIPFEKFKDGRIPPNEAKELVSKIQQIVNSGMKDQTYSLNGCTLLRVSDDGHRLAPMITQAELPVYLDECSQEAEALLSNLKCILREAKKKFWRYRGIRVLLIDISQCGLVIDYHAGFSKEGPGIVRKWLAALLAPSTRIDYVCLSPGIGLQQAGSGDRIFTGHKYVHKLSPHYPPEVWRRPGFPPIRQSSIN